MSWVLPGIIVNSLGKAWRTVYSGPYFAVQRHQPTRQLKNPPRPYRVVTVGFPLYKLAEGDDLESQKEAIRFLTRVILPQVEGKRSSKKIAKWLKQWHTGHVQIDQSKIDRFGDAGAQSQFLLSDESSTSASSEDEEVDDAAEQAEEDDAPHQEPRGEVRARMLGRQSGRRARSNSAGAMVQRESLGRLGGISQGLPLSSPLRLYQGRSSAIPDATAQDSATLSPVTDGTSKAGARDAFEGMNGVSDDDDDDEDERNSNPELGRPEEAGGATGWPAWTASPLEAIQQWVGGASTGDLKGGADTASGSPRPKPQENLTFLEIPFHAATLLTDPEITYSVAGGTRNLPFHVLREIALVRQRRRVLCALTGFTLLLRFCSFDFFCILLLLLNWTALYLMKNSRKVNVTLAKRSVRQRMVWAKQWANGLLGRRSHPLLLAPTTKAADNAATASAAAPGPGPTLSSSVPRKRLHEKGGTGGVSPAWYSGLKSPAALGRIGKSPPTSSVIGKAGADTAAALKPPPRPAPEAASGGGSGSLSDTMCERFGADKRIKDHYGALASVILEHRRSAEVLGRESESL